MNKTNKERWTLACVYIGVWVVIAWLLHSMLHVLRQHAKQPQPLPVLVDTDK